jgi:hypothetical protein
MAVNLPGECGNWTIRCTESKSGAKRGETPHWYGWKGELKTAYVIAAAPVMLDALEHLCALFDEHGNLMECHQDQLSVAIEKMDAAIKKAYHNASKIR